jgi:hypothetical protein
VGRALTGLRKRSIQNSPTNRRFPSTSIFVAAGCLGRPGMVAMSPQTMTTNSAPAAAFHAGHRPRRRLAQRDQHPPAESRGVSRFRLLSTLFPRVPKTAVEDSEAMLTRM